MDDFEPLLPTREGTRAGTSSSPPRDVHQRHHQTRNRHGNLPPGRRQATSAGWRNKKQAAVAPSNGEMEGLLSIESDPLLQSDKDDDDRYFSTRTSPTNVATQQHEHQEQIISPAALQSMRQRARQQHHHPRQNKHNMEIQHGGNPATDLRIWLCSHGCCCVQCVRTKEHGVLERFGEYKDLLGPGVYCLPWPCVRIATRMSLRVQQLHVTVETKTFDNVFLWITVAVQYRVRDTYLAHYTLTSHQKQIKSFVLDVVRSTVPTMNVDDVFLDTSEIAQEVYAKLSRSMESFGYEMTEPPLITELAVDPLVKASMNEINACKRRKEVMANKAETIKIQKIKQGEAEAERLYLNGIGVARERKAIAGGMKVVLVEKQLEYSNKDVMDILLLSQYMDTLAAVGADSMIVSSDPGQMTELRNQLSAYCNKEQSQQYSTRVPPVDKEIETETNQQNDATVSATDGGIPDLLW